MSADRRRAQILNSSREVFLRSGFAGTRVRELSRAAGVNEALLYQHFESKEALFEAAVTEPLAEAVQNLIVHGGLQGGGDLTTPEGRLQNLENLLTEMIATMVELGPLLGVMLFADSERGEAFYREHLLPALDAMAAATHEATAPWAIPGFNARLVVLSAFSTCLMLGADDHFGGDMLDDRIGVARTLARNILRGLEPPGGAR